MHMKNMLKKLAYLEFVNDQLSSELHYVDKLLKTVGFSEGLTTVKQAALELREQEGGANLREDTLPLE